VAALPTWPVWLERGRWLVGRPAVLDLSGAGATREVYAKNLAAAANRVGVARSAALASNVMPFRAREG
jgi:hypothetical protein